MRHRKEQHQEPGPVLNQEQEAILDLYLQHLDSFLDELKTSEKVQVEIETQHLKKILFK